MRWLLWLLAVFAAAVALALPGPHREGYVVLVYPPLQIQVSLLLALLGAVAAFGALYFALRLVGHALSLPDYVRSYRERRRRARAQAALIAAMQAYYEGRYARAEREAAVAADAGVAPGVAALLAARAAHQLRETARRDDWLARAEATGESMRAARLLSQAEMALEERDFAAARDALRSLHGAGPRNIATARMLLRAERGAQNWEEVLRLSTTLANRGALPPAIAEEHRVQAQIELLARESGDRASFEARLRRIAAVDLAHPRLAGAAARRAAELGDGTRARELIERSLGTEWNAALVQLYGDLDKLEPARRLDEARVRLERAERWLLEQPDDPQLLRSLGRLCTAAELWGKARDYLEASLAFDDSRAAHLDLARLAEREGRAAEAQRHFRRAGELR